MQVAISVFQGRSLQVRLLSLLLACRTYESLKSQSLAKTPVYRSAYVLKLPWYLFTSIHFSSTSTHTQHATPSHKPCQARRGRQSSATYVTQMYKRVWVVEFNFAVKGRLLMHLLQVSCDLTGMEPMSFVEDLFQSLAMHVLEICAYPTPPCQTQGAATCFVPWEMAAALRQGERFFRSESVSFTVDHPEKDHPKNIEKPRGPK